MKPIIMSTEDVRALLDGRKTMTRLAIKPQPVLIGMTGWPTPILHIPKKGPLFPGSSDPTSIDVRWRFAPYKPGDVLWVREKWRTVDYEYCDCRWSAAVEYADGSKGHRFFWYDNSDVGIPCESPYSKTGWRPSIHMPREAARLFLRVKDVRVERIHSITVEDAVKEGVYTDTPGYWDNGWSPTFNDPDSGGEPNYINGFKMEWDARNAKRGYGWDSNPFVWVVSFERLE